MDGERTPFFFSIFSVFCQNKSCFGRASNPSPLRVWKNERQQGWRGLENPRGIPREQRMASEAALRVLEPVRGVNTADHDTRGYLRALVERLKEDDGADPEAARLLADRALDEVRTHELKTICDRVCSRCIEQLAPAASIAALARLLRGLQAVAASRAEGESGAGADGGPSLRETSGLARVAIHSAGSHALEAVLATLADRVLVRVSAASAGADADDEEADEWTAALAELSHVALCLSDYATALMSDTYGSRVARALLRLMAGRVGDIDKKLQESAMPLTWAARSATAARGSGELPPTFAPPRELAAELRQLINACCDVELPAACWNASASPVLQVILECIPVAQSAVPAGKDQITSMLTIEELVRRTLQYDESDETSGNEHVSLLVGDPVGSHWLPAAFRAVGAPLFGEVFNRHFRSHVATIARDRFGNYVIQGLLEQAKDVNQWGEVFDELVGAVAEWIPRIGAPDAAALGVLAAMAASSMKFARGRGADAAVRRQQQLWRELKSHDPSVIEHAWTTWTTSQAASCALVSHLCRFRLPEQSGEHGTPRGDFVATVKRLSRVETPNGDEGGNAGQEAGVAPLLEVLTKRGLPIVATLEQLLDEFSIDERDAIAKVFSRRPQGIALNSLAVRLASATAAGSKLVQRVYACASVNAKRSIATVLGEVAEIRSTDNTLTTTRHGRLCLQVCRVQRFEEEDAAQQEQAVESNRKKRKMFQDILDDDAASGSPEKRSKVEERDEIDDMFDKI
jgi:NOP9-like PUF repeat domain